MPRQPRLDAPGLLQHVMARGIERRKLFRDDKDLELTEVGFLISDLCPLTSGPLELIRYIHLNPLRAGIVNDLKELDKYRWTGHSAILGRRRNPLLPEVRSQKSGMRHQITTSQQGQPNQVKKSTPSAEGGFSFSLSSGKEKNNKIPIIL